MSKIKKGDRLKFKDYEAFEENQKPILKAGDEIVVDELVGEDELQVHLVRDPSVKETVFLTEVQVAEVAPGKAMHIVPAKVMVKNKGKAAQEAPASKKAAVKAKKDPAPKPEKKTKTAKAKKASTPPATEEKKTEEPSGKKDEDPHQEEQLVVLPPEAYSESIRKVIKSGKSALSAAKDMVHRIGENYWDLGGVLSYINRNQSYKEIEVNGETPYSGKAGFADYVEKELGMQYRKAMYYIAIHESFAPLGVDAEKIVSIGWSKVKELAGVVTKKNVNKWLKLAESSTREELKDAIIKSQVEAGEGGGEVVPSSTRTTKTRFTFSLFADNGKLVEQALQQAREIIGSEDTSVGLVHIVSEWLAFQEPGAQTVPLDKALEAMEARYGQVDMAKTCRKRYEK